MNNADEGQEMHACWVELYRGVGFSHGFLHIPVSKIVPLEHSMHASLSFYTTQLLQLLEHLMHYY